MGRAKQRLVCSGSPLTVLLYKSVSASEASPSFGVLVSGAQTQDVGSGV